MSTSLSHASATVLLPHHSTWRTPVPLMPCGLLLLLLLPAAVWAAWKPWQLVRSNSDRLRWKSEETTQSLLSAVSRARSLPLGEGRMAGKGPRERRMSVRPDTDSRVRMVLDDAGEMSTSTRPELDTSGGRTCHENGDLLAASWGDRTWGRSAASRCRGSPSRPRSSSKRRLGNCHCTYRPPPVSATRPCSQILASTMPVSMASCPSGYWT